MSRRPILLTLTLLGCSDYTVYKQDNADIFSQVDAGAVDILLVVDNSCSMAPYQQQLAANFDNFLTFFIEGDVDYQIGVVTTTAIELDEDNIDPDLCSADDVAAIPTPGQLVDARVVRAETPDANTVFQEIVNVGTCGAGYEMGLEAARMAVEHATTGTANRGFVRPEAFLSVIFVSDEQDGSPLPVNDYINTFRQFKADADERAPFNASALVVDDLASCSEEQVESGAVEGSRYIDVAAQSQGIVANICGDDFASIVTELSLSSSRLQETFFLSDLPEASSLAVSVKSPGENEETDLPCEDGAWTYELRGEQPVIVFARDQLPPPRSSIVVEYDDGSGDPANFCASGEE